MTGRKTLFLVGPGFIGSEVIDELLRQNSYEITTLVRRDAAAAEFAKLGVKTIRGTIDDLETITKETKNNEIVIHTATADHQPSVEAIIAGVKSRAEDGKSTIYIHTSGTSELSDDSKGNYKSDKIFYDNKPEDIDALPDSASHREIDLCILRARKELGEKAKLAIVMPPLIYGKGARSGRLSIQLPTMTRFALKHGYAGTVGKGESLWSQVHVADLAVGYRILLQWLEGPSCGSIFQNPCFFAENAAEMSWRQCAEEIGRSLHDADRVKTPRVQTIPEDKYDDLFGMYSAWVIGSNSRSRAVRLRELGWKPQAKGTLESLRDDEIPVMLKETGDFKGYAGVAASGSG